MVDSEYSVDNYKSLKISIGLVIKHSEMLRFILYHLKTKKMCQDDFKKLSFVIRYVPDSYKTQEMSDIVILKNDEVLLFVPYCYSVINLLIINLLNTLFRLFNY